MRKKIVKERRLFYRYALECINVISHIEHYPSINALRKKVDLFRWKLE